MTEYWTLEQAELAAKIDAGDVDTGSAWDGEHIIDVYADLERQYGPVVAVEQAHQIRENRLAAITMNGHNGRVS